MKQKPIETTIAWSLRRRPKSSRNVVLTQGASRGSAVLGVGDGAGRIVLHVLSARDCRRLAAALTVFAEGAPLVTNVPAMEIHLNRGK